MLQLYGWNGRLYHRKLGGVGTIKGWNASERESMHPMERAYLRGESMIRMGEEEMSISTPLR